MKHLLIVGISFLALCVLIVGFFITRYGGHGTNNVAYGAITIVLYFSMVIAAAAVVIAVRQVSMARSREVLPYQAIDAAKFKRFQDCLDALSLGIGRTSPPLLVTNVPEPLAYVGFYKSRALAITNDMLHADFTYQEIEAIMAVLLGMTVIDTGQEEFTRDIYNRWVDELKVNDSIVNLVRTDFYQDAICLFPILADMWAVRLTGQPDALKDAIVKSKRLLTLSSATPRGAEPCKTFVEPAAPQGAGFINMPRWLSNVRSQSSGPTRDRIIQLRLENLDIIKQGMRQPHSEMRNGMPVTRPEGWR
ncbi:MAG: hypothetical protein ACYC99_09130 [Candidatus Geothermincolia bacterium]